MSSKIETRLHLAKGTLYTAAIQALLVESGIMDFFVEANTATLQADREDWEPGTDRLTIINALAAEINYNSIWMDGGGTVHCSAFRMPSCSVYASVGIYLPSGRRTPSMVSTGWITSVR